MSSSSVSAVQPGRSPLREVGRFAVLAFAGAWLVGGIGAFVLDLGQLGLGIGVLMVAVAALVCARRDEGSVRPMVSRILQWRVAPRWYLVALGVPFVALAAAMLVAPLVGEVEPRPGTPLTLLLLLPLYVLLLGGPEELGWRGYALPRLQTRFGALTSTMLLAGLWMLWHAPLFFIPDVPGFSELPVVPYLTVGVASSVIYTWLYNSTQGSILLAMLLHAAKNLSLAWLVWDTDFAIYAWAWIVVAVALIAVYGPSNLSRLPRQQVTVADVQGTPVPAPAGAV